MTDAEVAELLRKEYRLLNELTRKLGPIVDQPQAGDAALDELRKTFEHLRAHLHRQMALEEAGGFLKNVLDRRPTLSREVEHLREEHQRILGMVDGLYGEVGRIDPKDDAAWADCRLRIRHCLSEVAHHEKTENMLVLHVFGMDIGAGD